VPVQIAACDAALDRVLALESSCRRSFHPDAEIFKNVLEFSLEQPPSSRSSRTNSGLEIETIFVVAALPSEPGWARVWKEGLVRVYDVELAFRRNYREGIDVLLIDDVLRNQRGVRVGRGDEQLALALGARRTLARSGIVLLRSALPARGAARERIRPRDRASCGTSACRARPRHRRRACVQSTRPAIGIS
jgi:hypothetical protein